MHKKALLFGGLVGAAMSISFMLSIDLMTQADGTMDFSKGELIGYSSMLLSLVLVFLGIRSYKNSISPQPLSFGRALGLGTYLVAVASTIYALVWMWYYANYAQNFMTEYSAYVIECAAQEGATATELAAKEAEMASMSSLYENPLVRFGMTFMEYFPIGFVGALIGSAILRTRK